MKRDCEYGTKYQTKEWPYILDNKHSNQNNNNNSLEVH